MHQIKPSSRQTRVTPRSNPSEIVTATGLHSGERLDIETHDGEIIIRRAVPRFTLGELFRGKTPKSGGEPTRALLIGALTSVVRSSRNDGFGLPARHGRSNLDAGEILTSHIRSIDTQARPIRFAGAAVLGETARLVRAKLTTFITN